MLSDSWLLVGVLTFSNPKTDLTVGLFQLLTNRIVKIKTVSTIVNGWRRGCYMKQVVDQSEVSNNIVPLNQETIFELSHLVESYALVFTPIRWLPDLVVYVYEYSGSSEVLPEYVDQDSSVNDGVVSD
jgi:hypothetical protein